MGCRHTRNGGRCKLTRLGGRSGRAEHYRPRPPYPASFCERTARTNLICVACWSCSSRKPSKGVVYTESHEIRNVQHRRIFQPRRLGKQQSAAQNMISAVWWNAPITSIVAQSFYHPVTDGRKQTSPTRLSRRTAQHCGTVSSESVPRYSLPTRCGSCAPKLGANFICFLLCFVWLEWNLLADAGHNRCSTRAQHTIHDCCGLHVEWRGIPMPNLMLPIHSRIIVFEVFMIITIHFAQN